MELKTVTLDQQRQAARYLLYNLCQQLATHQRCTAEWAEDLAGKTIRDLFSILGLVTVGQLKDVGLPLRDQAKQASHCTVKGVSFVWIKNPPVEQAAFDGLWICKLCTAIVVDEEHHADDHAALMYKNDLTRIALTSPILNTQPTVESNAFNPHHPKNWT